MNYYRSTCCAHDQANCSPQWFVEREREGGIREDVEKKKFSNFTDFVHYLHYILHTLQVHRACMLATLFIGLIGVAMVFIGHAHENNPRGLIHLGTHHVSGCISILLKLSLMMLLRLLNCLACHYGPFYHRTHHRPASSCKCK